MADPLADVVTLLQPGAPFTKSVSGAGRWRVRRADAGKPFYAAVLDGACRLAIRGAAPVVLEAGDFVLVPAAFGFVVSSLEPPGDAPDDTPDEPPAVLADGGVRHGDPDGPPDVRMLVGYCTFASPDAELLVSLLPRFVHVRGEPRLSMLVDLVQDEARAQRPGRDVIFTRLFELLLIEALRYSSGTEASPGLLSGLADERLAPALRRVHENPSRAWTVAELAAEGALSRSAFFERFKRVVGKTPAEYLLGWRMALAKNLLRREKASVSEVAERVGYGSASAFSVAFTREAGCPPARFARFAREDRQPTVTER